MLSTLVRPSRDPYAKGLWTVFRKSMYVCVAALLILLGIPRYACSLTVSSGPMQDYLFKEGKRHYDGGDFDRAREVWSNLFPGKLYGPVSYLLLAQGWADKGEHAKAESLLRQCWQQHPEGVYSHVTRDALVDALYRQGKPEAKTLISAMLEKAPEKDKPSLILRLAELDRRMSNYADAAARYRRLFVKYPATVEGLQAADGIAWLVFHNKIPRMMFSEPEEMERANALFAKGRFDLAGEAYHALLRLKPTDKGLKLQIGRCLHKDRKDQKAIAVLKEVLAGQVSDKDRMEALHLLSLVYWRLDRDKDFELCSKALAEKAPVVLKRKALFNLAAHQFEKHRFDEALSTLDRFLKTQPDASFASQAKWRIAWIKYSAKKYAEAADAFREVRQVSANGSMGSASKYWQAKSLLSANRSKDAQALLKEVVESHPFHYYGIASERLLKDMKVPLNQKKKTERPFPDVRLSTEEKKNPLVIAAEKLMELDLQEFAFMNLTALPKSTRSSPAIAFLSARAAYGAHQYKVALDVLFGAFGPFMENPPPDAPADFIEMAYPRVHFTDTVRLAQKHSIDPHLIWAIIRQESRYDAEAVSPAGALGLMQVTPGAAGFAPKKGKIPAQAIAEILTPQRNLEFGVRVLAKNLSSFQGKIVPAVASYNADIRKVRAWMQSNGKMKQDEFIEHIPFRETRLYVKNVLAGYRAYAQLHKKNDLAGLW
jgi:soluble lytic murein transglycosylase